MSIKQQRLFNLTLISLYILILYSVGVFGLTSNEIKQTDSILDINNVDLNSEELSVNSFGNKPLVPPKPGAKKTEDPLYATPDKTHLKKRRGSDSNTKSADSNTKSADSDTKSADSNTKSADSDTKSADSDTESADSDTEAADFEDPRFWTPGKHKQGRAVEYASVDILKPDRPRIQKDDNKETDYAKIKFVKREEDPTASLPRKKRSYFETFHFMKKAHNEYPQIPSSREGKIEKIGKFRTDLRHTYIGATLSLKDLESCQKAKGGFAYVKEGNPQLHFTDKKPTDLTQHDLLLTESETKKLRSFLNKNMDIQKWSLASPKYSVVFINDEKKLSVELQQSALTLVGLQTAIKDRRFIDEDDLLMSSHLSGIRVYVVEDEISGTQILQENCMNFGIMFFVASATGTRSVIANRFARGEVKLFNEQIVIDNDRHSRRNHLRKVAALTNSIANQILYISPAMALCEDAVQAGYWAVNTSTEINGRSAFDLRTLNSFNAHMNFKKGKRSF